jgi:hypothetical protein
VREAWQSNECAACSPDSRSHLGIHAAGEHKKIHLLLPKQTALTSRSPPTPTSQYKVDPCLTSAALNEPHFVPASAPETPESGGYNVSKPYRGSNLMISTDNVTRDPSVPSSAPGQHLDGDHFTAGPLGTMPHTDFQQCSVPSAWSTLQVNSVSCHLPGHPYR